MSSARIAIIVTLFGATCARPAAATPRKLDHALERLAANGSGGVASVIIRAADGCAALKNTVESHGRIRAAHHGIHAISADVDAQDLRAIADVPCVESVSLDAPVTAHQTTGTSGPLITLDALRTLVGADQTSFPGKNIGVAIVDSGIANVPDLHDGISAFYDFTRGGVPVAAFDDYGHGSHIAATIASTGKQNSGRYQGIAPAVTLIGLKVLDANGNGSTSDVISALEFATANRSLLGVDVINLSLGHPILESATTDPLVQAVEAAVRAGIVVVVSAGNFGTNPNTGQVGYGGITSPGNAPSAITVGASQTFGTSARGDDVVAPYSSRGPSWYDGFAKPDLVAPGDRVVADTSNATLYKLHPTLQFKAPAGSSGLYMRLSGSSMAAAVVSGVVAQLLDANRSIKEADGSAMAQLSPYAVKAILQYTATPLFNDDALAQGAGEINAIGAIALAGALDTRSSPWTVGAISAATPFGGELRTWGMNIVWGTGSIQGPAADNIVWGTNDLWAHNVV